MVGEIKDLRKMQEQELVLLDELQRRGESDPLRLFQPHEKQKEFIESVLTSALSENWFFAANRAGKSDAGAVCGATLARYGDQGSDVKYVGGKGSSIQVRDRATSGWVSALDFPTSRDTIQPKYFDNGFVPPGSSHEPFIPEREISEWRVADQILKLKNGSIIGFKSADSGRLKYQGADKDWVHMDEEHPEDIFNEISIRVGARRLRRFTTATILPPVGMLGGISWTFPKIIQPWLDGLKPNIGVFNASIYDNPHIPAEEIRNLEALFPEGSIDRKIRLNGELIPGISGSRAYSAFSSQINVAPQPDINFRRPLCWIWDFNVDPLVSLVGQMENLRGDKKLFRVHRELIISGSGNIAEMCEYFKQIYPRHGSEIWIYGDATSKGRSRQTGKSDYTLIANEMRTYGVPVRFKVPEANPPVPDRINAVNRVCRDENAEVCLVLDPSCTELKLDMEGVLRDGRGGIKKTYNDKDPYFKRTHTSDALGYWISKEAPVKLTSRETQRKPLKMKPPSYSKVH